MSQPTPLPCRRCDQPTTDPHCVCADCRQQTLREFEQMERRGIKIEPLDRRESRG